jgi:magnesium transporter
VARYDVIWVEAKTGRATPMEGDDLAGLLARNDGWVWVDIPEVGEEEQALLTEVFHLHPLAVQDCAARNHVARLHYYRTYLFLALHLPLSGASGHVHYLELDQIVGRNFLITTHGPHAAAVASEHLLVETRELADRLLRGRIAARRPIALSYALVSNLTNTLERIVNASASEIGLLEKRVMMQADEENPQRFLDELFTVRHLLLTIHTMAAQSTEVLIRATHLMAEHGKGTQRLLSDLKDQYARLGRITHAQMGFLHGVTDFYRARTDTRMAIAAERLAVIAAVTLPITAISSVMGMNVIVNGSTHWLLLGILLTVMLAMSVILLRWAHRQGWW